MLPSDLVARWIVSPDDLLSDERAIHYWDDTKVIGQWYERNVTKLGIPAEERVEWDAYFLYDEDSIWGEQPPEHVSWGRTIMDSREQLLEDFEGLVVKEETR